LTRVLSIVGFALLSSWALAQSASGPVVKGAGDIDWKASGSLPPGAEYHLIYEDPKTHAVQTLVRMPKGYSLPKHAHTADETMLVLKGKLVLIFEDKKELSVGTGGYAVIPAGTSFELKVPGFGGATFLAAFNGPYDAK
jgi:quercetin dioxygenase-like cupin family protein